MIIDEYKMLHEAKGDLIKFLDSNAEEYDIQIPFIKVPTTNEQLSEIAAQHVLDLIIEEYDKCDNDGYEMPQWLLNGIWGFIVGDDGNKELFRFDWLGCVDVANEEIKNRPSTPKIIIPSKNIFIR